MKRLFLLITILLASQLLSAQYDKHIKFEINPNIKEEYTKRLENQNNKIKKSGSKSKVNLVIENDDITDIQLTDIINIEMLTKAVENIMLKL